MTIAHYALIIAMSLLISIGVFAMMYEDSKANDVLMYVAFAIAITCLLVIFFGR